MFLLASLFDNFTHVPDAVRAASFIALFLVYEPLCTTLGCTLGNYIKRIRVKKATNTAHRINFLQAVIRYVLKVLLGWISFLTIHSNNQKRAIHDFASGSVMVKR
jgi:hypothetical protein